MSVACGGVAQLARATGSYPVGHGFKSNLRYQIRPVGQAAKTPPFHGGNGSSILPRVTKKKLNRFFDLAFFIQAAGLVCHQCACALYGIAEGGCHHAQACMFFPAA